MERRPGESLAGMLARYESAASEESSSLREALRAGYRRAMAAADDPSFGGERMEPLARSLARMKCRKCRRWMIGKPTEATPLQRADPPDAHLCIECKVGAVFG